MHVDPRDDFAEARIHPRLCLLLLERMHPPLTAFQSRVHKIQNGLKGFHINHSTISFTLPT